MKKCAKIVSVLVFVGLLFGEAEEQEKADFVL